VKWRAFPTLLCLLLIPVATGAASTRPLPGPLGYVSDHGSVLEPDWRARLRSVGQDLERKAAVEMVVVTVPDLNGFSSGEDYAAELYRRWGIGTTQQDRGILVLASVGDRHVAVTVGPAMQQALPADLQERLAAKYLQPLLRRGQYGEGLYRLTVALATAAQQGRQDADGRTGRKTFGIVLTVLTGVGALAFLWWISRPDLRHPYRRLRRGEFWGSGQGGYGGNFGGFGGGMGGEGLK
jgi:uncharacterized protein